MDQVQPHNQINQATEDQNLFKYKGQKMSPSEGHVLTKTSQKREREARERGQETKGMGNNGRQNGSSTVLRFGKKTNLTDR